MKWIAKINGNLEIILTNVKPDNEDANAQLMDASLWNERDEYIILSETTVDSKQVYHAALDQGTKDADIASDAAKKVAQDAFNVLTDEIELDAASTAGTTNQISGLMDLLTYMRMKDAPELFDGESLVAKKDVSGFTKGDALDTALKVSQYAEAMLAESDQFMIRRMKKITDYIIGG